MGKHRFLGNIIGLDSTVKTFISADYAEMRVLISGCIPISISVIVVKNGIPAISQNTLRGIDVISEMGAS